MLREEEEILGDEIGGIDRLAVFLVGALAKATAGVDEIAGLALVLDPLDRALIENGRRVPMGVVVPGAVFLFARIIRGDVGVESGRGPNDTLSA